MARRLVHVKTVCERLYNCNGRRTSAIVKVIAIKVLKGVLIEYVTLFLDYLITYIWLFLFTANSIVTFKGENSIFCNFIHEFLL